MSTVESSPIHQPVRSQANGVPSLAQVRAENEMTGRDLSWRMSLIGLALICLYAPVFKGLWNLWMTREDYSHGFVVPLISLYLIKTKWEWLRDLPIVPVPTLGVGIMTVSLVGMLFGVTGGVITLSSITFIGMLIGLTLILLGFSYLQALVFPFSYLVFMTPVLDVIVEPLHHPFQLLAAKAASLSYQAIGVPTYLDGTFIHFPNGILEVAVQCSGANFLISILAIGLPLASLALRTWWTRVTLLIAALVISIVANWARVALIGLIGYLWGWGPQVHGPLHILQGMLVYWVGFGALFGGAWILAKTERRKDMLGNDQALRPSYPMVAPDWQTWRRGWWVALATLAVATVYLYGYDRGPVAAKQSFASFPLTIGKWTAVGSQQGSPLVMIKGADQELIRIYRNADGSTVCLYIAYLNSQTQGRELVSYLTAPLHKNASESRLSVGGEGLPVNAGFDESHARTPILFWYDLNGRAVADRYRAKLATILQVLAHDGSNGALVLISGGSQKEGQEFAAGHLENFARDLVPVLRSYLP